MRESEEEGRGRGGIGEGSCWRVALSPLLTAPLCEAVCVHVCVRLCLRVRECV